MIAGVTVLTEQLFTAHTVYTPVTAAAYFVVCTVRTFFFTALTNCGTFRASGTTVAYSLNTACAVTAFKAPAVVAHTFVAAVTASAEIVVAVVAVLAAIGTNHRTLGASVTVVADHVNTVSADVTVIAPAVVPHAVLTFTAVSAYIAGTVCALLCTFGTNLRTLGAAVSAVANIFGAVYTRFTALAEIALTANAVKADVTSAADERFCTFHTFFVTFLAHGGTL